MTEVKQRRIARFNAKHDLSLDSQFRQLVEEVGELAESVNRDGEGAEIAEELADVVFVARSMAEIQDINLTEVINDVAEENLEKDESTDGAKVTKDGLTDGGEDTEDPSIEQRLRQLKRDVDDDQIAVNLQRAIELRQRGEDS